MKFVRTLTEKEIVGALEKGRERAVQILERAAQNPDYLTTAYRGVLYCVDRAEDNFSKEGYAEKDDRYEASGKFLTEKNIRGLFLSAVEAVECLEDIEPEVEKLTSRSSSMAIGCATDRHIKLIKAANVFRTDGKSDEPAYDIEDIIQTYRGQSPVIAAQ